MICGVTLGRFSFIGAGAVVTHDVPDYALMVGVPAQQIGWMCYCGIQLPVSDARPRCPSCGRQYSVDDGICTELSGAETEVARIRPENDIPLRDRIAI